MKFHYVNDDVPAEGTALLAAAAAAREIEFVEVAARGFDFDERRRPESGDLLYRPAVSLAAMRVEQFLYREQIATFYAHSTGPLFGPLADHVIHERAGIPIPRTIPCATTDRRLLRLVVEQLGGFPIVIKLRGLSGGLGVMLVESLAGLFSQIDYLLNAGQNPLFCAYIPDSVHWRVIVVGSSALAAYRNPLESDDFRSYASSDRQEYLDAIPSALAEIAVRSVEVLGYEMGGVDLLEHASGRIYLLETNFPCYFPQAQLAAGIDIAGAMVEHLAQKSERVAVRG